MILYVNDPSTNPELHELRFVDHRHSGPFLIESDQSRKKRKKVIDKMSAVIILQSFLDRRMMNKEIKK